MLLRLYQAKTRIEKSAKIMQYLLISNYIQHGNLSSNDQGVYYQVPLILIGNMVLTFYPFVDLGIPLLSVSWPVLAQLVHVRNFTPYITLHTITLRGEKLQRILIIHLMEEQKLEAWYHGLHLHPSVMSMTSQQRLLTHSFQSKLWTHIIFRNSGCRNSKCSVAHGQ